MKTPIMVKLVWVVHYFLPNFLSCSVLISAQTDSYTTNTAKSRLSDNLFIQLSESINLWYDAVSGDRDAGCWTYNSLKTAFQENLIGQLD